MYLYKLSSYYAVGRYSIYSYVCVCIYFVTLLELLCHTVRMLKQVVIKPYQWESFENHLVFSRTIREVMFIRDSDPALNRNLGNTNYPNVWDSILLETPALQLKPSSLPLTPSQPY